MSSGGMGGSSLTATPFPIGSCGGQRFASSRRAWLFFLHLDLHPTVRMESAPAIA